MIQHYLKIAIRQLTKQRSRTIISIIGIASGLFCFSICSYYNRVMTSENKDLSTYHQLAEIRPIGNTYQMGLSPQEFEKIGIDQFEAVAYYSNMSEYITLNEETYCRANVTECNRDYFKVFPADCISGSIEEFNDSLNVAIITTDFAKRFYKTTSPLGETLRTPHGKNYTIIAVIKPYPKGLEKYPDQYDIFHPFSNSVTHASHKLLMKQPKDVEQLNIRLSHLILFPDQPDRKGEIILDNKSKQTLGADTYIAIIGFLVLLVSIINFFSFSINSFINRYHELSLRNILGEKRFGLFFMLFIEQGIMILLGAFLSMAFAESILPLIISHLSREAQNGLSIDIRLLWKYELQYLLILLFISAIISFISVWKISRKTAIQGIRGGTIGRQHIIRNTLLGFQFFISLLFLIGTAGVELQMQTYETKANTTLSKTERQNIVVIPCHLPKVQQNMQALISFLHTREWNEKMAWTNSGFDEQGPMEIKGVTEDYFDIMQIKKRHRAGEPFCYVNNELNYALKNDSTPNLLNYQNQTYSIKGVISTSCESPSIQKMALIPYQEGKPIEEIYIRLTPNAKHREVVADLKNEINKYLPINEPYEYLTLHQKTTKDGAKVLMGLFVSCSIICILITILGVYSTINIDTSRRQKEVVIRKINGAGIANIYWLFGKSYITIFTITSILAVTLCLYIMIIGTQSQIIIFQYTTPFLWITPLISMLSIIICTISWRIFHISRINPANILKND